MSSPYLDGYVHGTGNLRVLSSCRQWLDTEDHDPDRVEVQRP